MRRLMVLFALSLIVAGCGSDPNPNVLPAETLPAGQPLYEEPHEDGNTFACATCHALSEPADDGFTRPGHPIGDAALRPSYKDAQLSTFLEAVNTCRTHWLNTTAFEASDPRWKALSGYLLEQAKTITGGATTAEALSLQIVDPPSDITGGDPVVGEDTFNHRCIVCHGESAIGTVRAPAIAGTMLPGDFIARKVRRSGNPDSSIYPNLIPGRMPFWQADRVSDDQLRDILAFLAMSEPAIKPMDTTGGERVDLSSDGAQEGCSSNHPAVGQTLMFKTVAHLVAGTATIVDDCTIHFDEFSFDGGGIDVHVIGAKDGAFKSGTDLSINMVGTAFDGGTALVRLPLGVTLDDFDELSIWCVPVGFSFGDGSFQ